MRRINRHSAAACLAGAALILLAANVATAQQTCYRVTDLGALNFAPGLDDIFGINNLGEVAFTVDVDPGVPADKHAFLWLPQPNYGFATGG